MGKYIGAARTLVLDGDAFRRMHVISVINELIEKIAEECSKAGASKWEALKIIKILEQRETRDIDEMREIALEKLREMNPQAANVYESFEKMQVYTSAENIEAFDRGNIIESLLKETNVSRSVAEKIGSEVEDKIKDLKIRHITTALIRTMVNVKLLEYGHEEIYRQYSRLGLPNYEVKKALEKGIEPKNAILREYNIQNVIPAEARELHFENKIYISDLENFSTKKLAGNLLPEGVKSYSELVSKYLGMQNEFSLPLNISGANFMLEDAPKSRINKISSEFSDMISAIMQQGLEMPAAGIDLYCRGEGCKIVKKNTAMDFGVALADKISKNEKLATAICVDSRYKLKLIEELRFINGTKILNCENRELFALNGNRFAKGFDSAKMEICVNMPIIAKEANGNDSLLEEKLLQICAAMLKLEEKKNSLLKNNSGCNLAMLHGLESSTLLFSEDEKSSAGIGRKIIDILVKNTHEEWLFGNSCSEIAAGKFAKFNSRKFSVPEKGIEIALKNKDRTVFCNYAQDLKEASKLIGDGSDCVVIRK